MFQEFSDAFYDALREADRTAEMEELTGEPANDSPTYHGPHSELVAMLVNMTEQATERMKHEHMWDEDCGFCLICGKDGNA